MGARVCGSLGACGRLGRHGRQARQKTFPCRLLASSRDKLENNIPNQSSTLAVISQLSRERDERRKQAEVARARRAEDSRSLAAAGKFGDSTFVGMIERYRAQLATPAPHVLGDARINVCFPKEFVHALMIHLLYRS